MVDMFPESAVRAKPLTLHQWARRCSRGLCMVRTGQRFCLVLFSVQDLERVTASHSLAPSPVASPFPNNLGRRYR